MHSQIQYLPITPAFFAILVLAFGALIVLIQLGILRYAYMKLGVSSGTAMLLLLGSLVGSYFNIPITMLPGPVARSGEVIDFFGMQYVVPLVHQWPGTLLAVNIGGAVIPTIDAACRLAAEREVPLLISGGVGHSTNYLYEAVRQDTRYRMLPVVGRPEAHILADIAHDYWHIPRSRLVVEDQSTNCGENARFTRTTLENGGIPHRRGIVIQDPTM
ncbi:MAG: DUF1614 domain-containing protein, partial [Bradyrhizobium sp.]|nr:DUF1614 domain-containing protein [Bradyrhizobium sp.]